MNRLAGDVVARVYPLGSNVALLAVHGRCRCQGRVPRSISWGEAIYRRWNLCDAADSILQIAERLLGLLQLSTDALPVLPRSACTHCPFRLDAHLSGQRNSAAVYMDQAVGEVMSVVLSDAEVYSFRSGVRLAGGVVGT